MPEGIRPYDVDMTFTAIHRSLGAVPGPLTNDLLDAAVDAGVAETNDLDWKSELPPAKGIPQTDFPKDVAAMANSGGGLIVFGVREAQKAATGRVDVGHFDEAYERSLRSAAITAITPPVFGLIIHKLQGEGELAIAVEVHGSSDGPHLIYKNDYFGAPVRNDSDTVWMKERQIEAMYRARFDERRHAHEALDELHNEASAGRKTDTRAWFIAVANPRVPTLRGRLSHTEAQETLAKAEGLASLYAGRGAGRPLENVDRLNPRPGLRRWVAVNTAVGERSAWKEAWASIHHDGSVTLTAAIGGHRMSADGYFGGWQVESAGIERAVADLMGLLRATAEVSDNDDYNVRVGIEWTGAEPLSILTTDNSGYTYEGVSTPLHHYSPVTVTVNAKDTDPGFLDSVHDLARDCINQGGVSNVRLIRPPRRDEEG